MIKAVLKYFLPPQWLRFISLTKANKSKPVIFSRSKLTDSSTKSFPNTFVLAVGPSFNENLPTAMTVARLGYCHAFESLGMPYKIVDIQNIDSELGEIENPLVMYMAEDIFYLKKSNITDLKQYRSVVWVPPNFNGSDIFFKKNNLSPYYWMLPKSSYGKIVDLEPQFFITGTVPSGLEYFEKWKSYAPVKSYPLACDTSIYNKFNATHHKFLENIELIFIGGYWKSKGENIDRYLRQFEESLVIYGYSQWPYKNYRGLLPQDGSEAALYRQAKVSPVINEPTVKLLHGQINERVFKIFGSGGCPVVDDVPWYRELYGENELLIASGPNDFREIVRSLLENEDLNMQFRQSGLEATLSRHTYEHRVRQLLLDINK